ncbi:inosine/xanthosine triphosphatase [Alteromonas ponticola]|uniref:Inosine/xanthosine triphosphatase n=1 Tax=Alteromonas aquimaris TaxID=2998417 RepID=A0ABT3P8I8_9ALTE|nr:inosine/xanthosine triphosphatase [Alteromonas aquimaris]MCW8109039.1 inosine/xanthosine triphosphatase [Alteromonas aquimaris]
MKKLLVGSRNPIKVAAAKQAFMKAFSTQSLLAEGINSPSGVNRQPMSEAETRLGAINRVNAILEDSHLCVMETDWVVAIEGGAQQFVDGPATFAYIAIWHQHKWSIGRSANLPLPSPIYQALEQGQELGDVMDEYFGTSNVKQKGGAIGLLTNNLATRQSVYELAIILALSKFQHEIGCSPVTTVKILLMSAE